MPDLTKQSVHSRSAGLRLLLAGAIVITLFTISGCTRSNASSDKPAVSAQSPRSQASATPSRVAYPSTDLAPALAELQGKAESGNTKAMVQLAEAYEKGEGVPPDTEQAATWLKKAADKGDSYAMYRLGRLYATGSGVQKDYVEAFDWYKRASAAGNSEAMYDLGRAYETGAGVREDVQQAVLWYTKAYQHGNQTAKAALVRLGEGFEDHP